MKDEEKIIKPKIIDAIPISKAIIRESLSYFTLGDVLLGSIIKAPLRKKTIPALVFAIRDAEADKTQIKASPFQIRKIEKFKPKKIFLKKFIDTIGETAEYFACSSGAVLEAITPKKILENANEISEAIEIETKSDSPETFEKYILQTEDEERYSTYKSLIRESFAKKQSVIMITPTIHDAKRIYETLAKGIERYAVILHSSLSKSELIRLWNFSATEEHPVLIISTGSFLGIPRKDVGVVIVERENSRAYKQSSRPFLDFRIFAEKFAEKIKAKFVLGDSAVRTETMWRFEKAHELSELSPVKIRSLSKSRQEIVDMKKERVEKEFSVLSDSLRQLIKDARSNNENIFIFSARRGLSPSTYCGDCGTLVKCDLCSAPAVLHSGSKGNYFLCHQCGKKRSAEELCKICGSWKLETLGIGIELLEKKISEEFPDAKIWKMDKDSVTTEKRAGEMMKKFYSSPGGILLGTEMALSYLDKEIENSAIASIDSLFSIPDFRIKEKILHTLLRIRALTKKNFLIQTKDTELKVLDYAVKGSIVDFYREEIIEREKYGYPPFSTFIKLSLQGDKNKVLSEMEKAKNMLLPHMLFIFPAFIEKIKKQYQMNGVIKMDRNKWPDKDLINKLLSLPPQFGINVDPESLL